MACGPDVDQASSLAGAAALRVADLGRQGDPRRLPPTSEPRPGNRLVRGSPGGVWARDIPYLDGLSLVTDGHEAPEAYASLGLRSVDRITYVMRVWRETNETRPSSSVAIPLRFSVWQVNAGPS
jgi:hypothetical protein